MTIVITLLSFALIAAVCYPIGRHLGTVSKQRAKTESAPRLRWVSVFYLNSAATMLMFVS
jgi:hypothetical protein